MSQLKAVVVCLWIQLHMVCDLHQMAMLYYYYIS